MSTVRLRRLTADYASLKEYTRCHPRLKLIQTDGDPPERYHIEYRIRSLRQIDGEMRVIKSHTVEILLPRNYPRTPPQCRMLTPVFHPNIAPHAICVGDHWSPGESLQSLVSRIGEMLAYQSYNVKSPLNGEAARWVADHEKELPLDPVSMIVDESRLPAPTAATSPASTPSLDSPAHTSDATSDASSEVSIEFDEVAQPEPTPETYSLNPQAGASAGSAPMRREVPERREVPQPTTPERAVVESATPAPAYAEPVKKPEKLAVQCPACGKTYRVPVTAAGRKANCSECATVFQIPSLPEQN